MNQPFKTQQEIYEHLVKGGKVSWISTGDVVGFYGGSLYNFTLKTPTKAWGFNTAENWKPYVEPTKLEFEVTIPEIHSRFHSVPIPNREELHGKKFKVVMTEIVGE